MNNKRRQQIKNILLRLETIKYDIDNVFGDENEYYDNIPENLQSSDRAIDSEEAIEMLEEALENIDLVIDNLNNIS